MPLEERGREELCPRQESAASYTSPIEALNRCIRTCSGGVLSFGVGHYMTKPQDAQRGYHRTRSKAIKKNKDTSVSVDEESEHGSGDSKREEVPIIWCNAIMTIIANIYVFLP
jgi:hypothetical protein